MESVHKISELQRESANQKRRIDSLTTQCKGFERDMQRVDSLARDVHKVTVEGLRTRSDLQRAVDIALDDFQQYKMATNNRLDTFQTLAAQVALQDETISQVQHLVSDTKTLLTNEFTKVREEFMTQAKSVTESAIKFEKALTDQKYWFDKYNDGFKEADAKFNIIKTELMSEID